MVAVVCLCPGIKHTFICVMQAAEMSVLRCCRWWFPLGVLVGAAGVLGSASALRHKTGVDLTKPASGVQYLGVLTGAHVS